MPFTALSRPFDSTRQSRPHAARSRGNATSENPSLSTRRAAGIRRGMLRIWAEFAPPLPFGVGGPITWALWRKLTCRATSRRVTCARTIPATEFSSAIAKAGMPESAANSAYSSACDPPVRKVKLDVMLSSVNAMGHYIHVLFSCGVRKCPGLNIVQTKVASLNSGTTQGSRLTPRVGANRIAGNSGCLGRRPKNGLFVTSAVGETRV